MRPNQLSTKELLDLSFKELSPLWAKSPPLTKEMAKIQRELTGKGCPHLQPKTYWGDEWFCPSESTSIAVPFYLSHKTLEKVETKLMGFAEGNTRSECIKLLRHEVGHCFDHAYKVSRTKEWQKVFGNPHKNYSPENYRYNPKSQGYVEHLGDHYAQSHPLEDFAETFAVWLNPKSQWKKKYRNCPKVIKKLSYIDKLVKKHGSKLPKATYDNSFYAASNLRIKLKTYYNRKRKTLNILS